MVTRSVKIDLISKVNPTVFATLNADVISAQGIPLGTSHSAVKKMVVDKEKMLLVLMPSILALNPTDAAWYARVKNYWDSFGIRIPIGGRTLETGLNFDINDSSRKANITRLIDSTTSNKEGTKTAKINSEGELADYVMANINDDNKYLYGHPINVDDYLIWQFCLGHNKVANDATVMSKSEKIDFVLIDPRKVELERRSAHTVGIEAKKLYLEILSDRHKVRDILYSIGENASVLDEVAMDMKLESYALANPTKFITLCKDTAVPTKARIERYIIKGILKKISNSSIIVDANDSTCVIGNSLEEAVAFFNTEKASNQAKIAEFTARYKSLAG
jgi:hypothetical protein